MYDTRGYAAEIMVCRTFGFLLLEFKSSAGGLFVHSKVSSEVQQKGIYLYYGLNIARAVGAKTQTGPYSTHTADSILKSQFPCTGSICEPNDSF